MLHLGESLFITHQDLGLHAADPREGSEFFKQVAKQIAAAATFENFVHRLKGYVLVQLLLVTCVADASDL